MSKRLQRIAKQQQSSVGEWVGRTLNEARARKPVLDSETKLQAVRRAVEHDFPSADIDTMLSEIERVGSVRCQKQTSELPSGPISATHLTADGPDCGGQAKNVIRLSTWYSDQADGRRIGSLLARATRWMRCKADFARPSIIGCARITTRRSSIWSSR